MNLYKIGYLKEYVDISNNSNTITQCYVVAPSIKVLTERVSFVIDNKDYKAVILAIEHISNNIII